MALYAFTPISLPPPPSAAPGTDFQTFAAAELASMDGADAGLVGQIAAANLFVTSGLADLAGLGQDLSAAALSLQDLLNESAADNLAPFLLAAAEQDNALASMANDVNTDLGGVLSGLADTLFNWFGTQMYIVEYDVLGIMYSQMQTEFYGFENEIMMILFSHGL